MSAAKPWAWFWKACWSTWSSTRTIWRIWSRRGLRTILLRKTRQSIYCMNCYQSKYFVQRNKFETQISDPSAVGLFQAKLLLQRPSARPPYTSVISWDSQPCQHRAHPWRFKRKHWKVKDIIDTFVDC